MLYYNYNEGTPKNPILIMKAPYSMCVVSDRIGALFDSERHVSQGEIELQVFGCSDKTHSTSATLRPLSLNPKA